MRNTKTITIEVEDEFYNEINEAAQETGLEGEFARAALGRLVKEFKRYGQVLLGNPVVMGNKEADAIMRGARFGIEQKSSDIAHALRVPLTEEQRSEMQASANRYGLSLEQACLYGFFNFEFKLDPNSGTEGWSMVHDLLEAQHPDKAWENRHKPHLPDWMKEEGPESKDEEAA